jgi:hypothetical protein
MPMLPPLLLLLLMVAVLLPCRLWRLCLWRVVVWLLPRRLLLSCRRRQRCLRRLRRSGWHGRRLQQHPYGALHTRCLVRLRQPQPQLVPLPPHGEAHGAVAARQGAEHRGLRGGVVAHPAPVLVLELERHAIDATAACASMASRATTAAVGCAAAAASEH